MPSPVLMPVRIGIIHTSLLPSKLRAGSTEVLIVDEKEPPQVDQDLVLIFDDWRLQDDGQIHAESFGSIGERAHGGRYGNVYTVNGSSDYQITAQAGDRLRLRLCNVSNANIIRSSDCRPQDAGYRA